MGILLLRNTESNGVVQKDTLIAAVYAQREATLRRVATLADADWELPCPVPPAPPGVVRLERSVRRVRDLVAHLIVVDEMVLQGGAIRSWMNLRRLGSSDAWDPRRIQPLTELSVMELVTLLARRGERFAQLAAAAPAAVNHLPLPSPFGRQPLLQVVARRVVHEWLHDRDLAGAQGVAPRSPQRAIGEVIAAAVLAGLPAASLPRVPLRHGVVRLLINIDPAAPEATHRSWSVDFTRRQYGPRVTVPADATVSMSAAALGLLATHRAGVDDETLGIEVDGDGGLAAALLAAITMPPRHDDVVESGTPLTTT